MTNKPFYVFLTAIVKFIVIILLIFLACEVFIWVVQREKANARTWMCQGRMREVACALAKYHDHYGNFPPAYSTDEQGNALHSWRVLILPYFNNQELSYIYKRIRLDEPWDSDWNTQFHESIKTYHCDCPSPILNIEASSQIGHANYFMVIDNYPQSIPENGILFAERHKGCNWMNPNHEIRLADTRNGVNTDSDGITSPHWYYLLLGSCVYGANVCTFDLKIIWVSNSSQRVP